MWSAGVRRRLDELREPFEGSQGSPSTSVTEATERLAQAITRHLGGEAEVAATADRLVNALDVVPQGMVLADASGTVVFRNRAATNFFAARHSEALVESAIAELIVVAVSGESDTRTLDLYGPPRRTLQLRAVPLEGAGAFLVVDDVSERQRLDAVRRDFVANISHELKTPVGALGVLAETLAGEDDPEIVARLAARMQKEAFRVARTIDDLLQLSQIEASGLPEPETVFVGRVLAEAVERTRAAADMADVRLEVEPVAAQLSVRGDRRQLISAVTNLCDNAVKYSDPAGVVTLSARRSEGDPGWLELSVADEGIGIPATDLDRVFERFYRVDRARSRDTGGTGLGLAIVRHVVQNHHGEVTVTSHEGEGSTFTLTLPCG